MTNVIDFEEARQRLQSPPVQWQLPRSIRELPLKERMFDADRLPFVSGLPTQFLSGDWL